MNYNNILNSFSEVTFSIALIIGWLICVVAIVLSIGIFIHQKKRNRYHDIVQNKNKQDMDTSSPNERCKQIPLTKLIFGDVNLPAIEEFRELQEKDKSRANFTTIQAGLKKHKNLNLFEDIIPYDYNRVKIKHPRKNIDFINASWIHRIQTDGVYDSIRMHPYLPAEQIAIIIAQDPKEATMDHHLQMIYEQNVDLIIQFLNSTEEMKLLDDEFKGSIFSKRMLWRYKISDFLTKEVWDVAKEKDKTLSVVFYRFDGWNGSKLSTDEMVQHMLTAITVFRKEMGNRRDMITTLLHDEVGGTSGASVFVSLLYLLEQVDDLMIARASKHGETTKDSNMCINIFEVVDNMRSKRMKMINTHEEYSFLFQAIIYYVEHKDKYDAKLKKQIDIPSHLSNVNGFASPIPHDIIEAEYVLPELKKHEYFDGYKVYDYTGGEFIEDDIYFD